MPQECGFCVTLLFDEHFEEFEMKNRSRSVALWSAAGGLAGSAVVLRIVAPLHPEWSIALAVLGFLLGGAVAYVAGDAARMLAGVKRAYRETVAWRPYWPYWKARGVFFLGVTTAGATCAMGMQVFLLIVESTAAEQVSSLLLGGIALAVIYGLAMATVLTPILGRGDQHEVTQKVGIQLLCYFNPVSVGVWLTWYLLKGVWWVIVNSPRMVRNVVAGSRRAAVLLRKFLRLTVLYMHDQQGALRWLGGGTGGLVGVVTGHEIVGAIAGFVAGKALEVLTEQVAKRLAAKP